jgi:hypothetical protein
MPVAGDKNAMLALVPGMPGCLVHSSVQILFNKSGFRCLDEKGPSGFHGGDHAGIPEVKPSS